jgi:methyl coenzyme M reductase subunit D
MNKTKIEKTASEIWSKFVEKYDLIRGDQSERNKNEKLKQIKNEEVDRLLPAFLAAVSIAEIKKTVDVEELEMEEILKVCDYVDNIYFHLKMGNLTKSQAEVRSMVKSVCIL